MLSLLFAGEISIVIVCNLKPHEGVLVLVKVSLMGRLTYVVEIVYIN